VDRVKPHRPASAAAEYIILSSEVNDGSWAGNVPAGGYGSLNTSTTIMSVAYVHAYALANVYTPTNAATDTWSAGNNWNFAPLSGSSTELTFVDKTGTTVLASGLTNTNTNNATTTFQANIIDLGGQGPPQERLQLSPSTTRIKLTLVADSLSGINPVVNLYATRAWPV